MIAQNLDLTARVVTDVHLDRYIRTPAQTTANFTAQHAVLQVGQHGVACGRLRLFVVDPLGEVFQAQQVFL